MEYYKTNTLEHHGIKGMHWGVRNGPPYPLTSSQKTSAEKKGTPSKGAVVKKKTAGSVKTSGGKNGGIDRNDWSRTEVAPGSNPQSASSMSNEELQAYNKRAGMERKYNNYTAPPAQESRPDYTIPLLNAVKNSTDNLQRAADNEYKNAVAKKKSEIDLSNVSDEDLRKAVNRMNLERQYRDLTPVEIKSGEEKFKNAMDIIGPVVATAASVAFIAYYVKQMVG